MQRKIRRLLKIVNIYITEEVYQDVNETEELNTTEEVYLDVNESFCIIRSSFFDVYIHSLLTKMVC